MARQEQNLIDQEADIFLTRAITEKMVSAICLSKAHISSPLPDYSSFGSLTVPNTFRVAELGFSKHGVHIIDFTYQDIDNREKTVAVVAKPLAREAFDHEVAAYTRLRESPVKFPSLKPAFYIQSQGQYFLGTVAESNLIPVANLLKNVFRQEHQPNRLLEAYDRLVSASVLALLRLHRVGILHEDWQPKNVGIDTRTGLVYAYDFELSQISEGVDSPRNRQESLEEINNLLAACAFYATQGYVPDDLIAEGTDAPRVSQAKRKQQLRSLGLAADHFISINEQLMEACGRYYAQINRDASRWSPVDHGIMQAVLYQARVH